MKRALVLGGGGSKGSYELGVWKALRRLNMKFDIVTGSSIGSINAALYACGEYRLAKKLWLTVSTSDLFSCELGENMSFNDYKNVFKQMIEDGGISFSKAEDFLRKFIDEEKLRKSKVDYGLVTVSLKTKKPKMLTKEQIPVGKLIDYISASSTCYPFVSKKEIDDDYFIDGGFYDNIPISLAISMGATEVVAVNLSAFSLVKKVNNPNVKIDMIKFNDPIKFTLKFDAKTAKRNIKYGYNDTMKHFKKLDGNNYTFKKGQLQKNYMKVEKKYKNIINELLLEPYNKTSVKFTSIFSIGKLNRILTKIKSDESIENEVNVAIEYLGKLFSIDDTNIYSINKFNNLLLKSVKELSYIKVNKKLKDKFLVSYIYNLCNSDKDKKKIAKEIYNVAVIFPKEFLAAIYLVTITRKNKFLFYLYNLDS